MVTLNFGFVTEVWATPKKTTTSVKKPVVAKKEKTAQECKPYSDRVEYQAGIVRHRFYDLHLDRHKLYPKYNTVPHPQGHGTYQGHIAKYYSEQDVLKQLVTDMRLNNCERYISANAHKWKDEKAPSKPNPSIAITAGFK